MYKIISAGKIVALCDAPRYVTRNPDTGALVEATAEEAIGVSVTGTLYNLNGGSGIPDAPEAVVSEVEGGEMVFIAISQADAVSTTSGIAFVAMAEAGTIDGVTAGEHADLFSPWAYPVNYTVGQIRRYTDGKLYKCLQAHTSQADWTPDTAVSLWVSISDPAEEWPEWSQPLGAHDAYSKGAKVSHNWKHWISDLDANVWEPGQYGWTEAPAEGPRRNEQPADDRGALHSLRGTEPHHSGDGPPAGGAGGHRPEGRDCKGGRPIPPDHRK